MTYRETYDIYMASEHWQNLRQQCFIKAGHKCEACGSDLSLVGHHLVYRTPLEDCTPADIMCLCWSDHEMFHDWLRKNGKREKDFNREKTAFYIRDLRQVRQHNETVGVPMPPKKPVFYNSKEQDFDYFRVLNPQTRSDCAHALKNFMKRANRDQMMKLYEFAKPFCPLVSRQSARLKCLRKSSRASNG